MKQKYQINGISCGGCVARVKKTLESHHYERSYFSCRTTKATRCAQWLYNHRNKLITTKKTNIMHFHDGHFGGMHLIWWIIWVILITWIFFIPADIPYQKRKKESPLDILKKRFAKGDITREDYEEAKKILKSE